MMIRELFTQIFRAVVAVAFVLVAGGCYNRFGSPSATEETPQVANITIGQLQTLLGSSDDYADISSDLTIVGSVTAHDEGGNFYKSFMLEQGGYSVEILEGLTESHVRHGIGYQVAVRLQGLRVARSYGVLQVGVATSSGSYYDLDYLGHEYLVDQHITNTGIYAPVTPQEYTFDELIDLGSLSTSSSGRLIRVSGVRYYAEDSDDGFWSGTHSFISSSDPLTDDEPEATIHCYTSSYSTFAQQLIPTSTGTITAILQYDQVSGTSAYSVLLKPRDQYDFEFE